MPARHHTYSDLCVDYVYGSNNCRYVFAVDLCDTDRAPKRTHRLSVLLAIVHVSIL